MEHEGVRGRRVCARRSGCRAAALVVLPLLFAAVAFGQELGSLEWFRAEWKAAERLGVPEGHYIEYSILTRVPGDEAELERLAGIIEGKPDHPLRRTHDELKTQIEIGPKTTRYRLWYGGPSRWRLSMTHPLHLPAGYEYAEIAYNGPRTWWMTPKELRLLDARRPPEGRNPAGLISALPHYINDWLAMGFSSGPLGITPVSSVVRDGVWEATTTSATGQRVWRYRGRIEGGRIVADNRELIVAEDDPTVVGYRSTWSDPLYIDAVGRWAAARVDRYDADGVAYMTTVLHEIRPLTSGELDGLLARPTPDGADPVRGPVTFTSIVDYGSGTAETWQDGERVTVSLPTDASRQPAPPWLKPAGWSLVAIIVGALVWFRLKRNH
ncbi:MAG: hypothetical protein KJZ54_00755 [Phycisphaerales bacterium]|nr:hypothetical protein [Phycisphaerales bacterium]